MTPSEKHSLIPFGFPLAVFVTRSAMALVTLKFDFLPFVCSEQRLQHGKCQILITFIRKTFKWNALSQKYNFLKVIHWSLYQKSESKLQSLYTEERRYSRKVLGNIFDRFVSNVSQVLLFKIYVAKSQRSLSFISDTEQIFPSNSSTI